MVLLVVEDGPAGVVSLGLNVDALDKVVDDCGPFSGCRFGEAAGEAF